MQTTWDSRIALDTGLHVRGSYVPIGGEYAIWTNGVSKTEGSGEHPIWSLLTRRLLEFHSHFLFSEALITHYPHKAIVKLNDPERSP